MFSLILINNYENTWKCNAIHHKLLEKNDGTISDTKIIKTWKCDHHGYDTDQINNVNINFMEKELLFIGNLED